MPLAVESRGNPPRAEETPSRLLSRSLFETQYDLDKTLSIAFSRLQDILGLASEKAMYAALQERIAEGVAQRTDTMNGLLYGILVDVQSAGKYLNCISFITRDGWASCLLILQCLVAEKYSKLLESVRAQMLWLLRQLVMLGVGDLEGLALDLLRQIAGGDLSHNNVWLAATLLEIFQSNQTWLYGSQSLLTSVLYTYLRILPDHAMARNSLLNDLRQSEATLCAQILRDKFSECMTIGRDLVRLIRDVSSMPEFDSLWKDLLSNPAAFNTPSFADLAQLYLARTPTRFINSRVTPDMESQLRFMLSHVRMGNQRRYQTWFAQRFLSAPESETLVPDLVRFICCCVHPTNQILRSDILPRWAILGWLLKCCKSNNVEASAKLALLYDWLFFATKSDNIMNIEPAILLMVHSIPKYADMTNSLLDFLFLLIEHYDTPRRELLQRGVTASIDILVGKGVVHSLEPLSASPLVALQLREKLIARFPAYCNAELPPPAPEPTSTAPIQMVAVCPTHVAPQPSTDLAVPAAVLPAAATPATPTVGTISEAEKAGTATEPKPQDSEAPSKSAIGSHSPGAKKRKRAATAEQDNAALVQSAVERFQGAVSGKVDEAPVAALKRLVSLFLQRSEINEPRGLGEPRELAQTGEVRDGSELPLRNSKAGSFSGDLANGVADPAAVTNSSKGVESLAQTLEDLSVQEGSLLFADLTEDPEADSVEERSMTSAILDTYATDARLEPVLLRWHRKGLPVRARLLCHAAAGVSQAMEEEEEATCSKISSGTRTVKGGQAELLTSGMENASLQGEEEREDGLVVHVGENSDEEGELVERDDEESQEQGQCQEMSIAAGESADHEERVRSGGKAECSSVGRTAREKASAWWDSGGKSSRTGRGGGPNEAKSSHCSRGFVAYEAFLRVSCVADANDHGVEGSVESAGNGESMLQANGESGEVGAAEGTGALVDGLVYDLRTLFLWNKSRMIWALPWVFRHLPDLSCSNIAIFQLLLATADPFELYDLELRLSLGEFTIVGPADDALTTLIADSVVWESAEQHALWQLLGAEAKASVSAPPLPQRLLTMAVQVDLSGTPEASGGLLRLLHAIEPTAELLATVLQLPSDYGKLPAAVLAGWAVTHKARLRTLVQQQQSAVPLAEPKASSRNGHNLPAHGVSMLQLLALFGGDNEFPHEGPGGNDGGGERGESSQGGGQGDRSGRPGFDALAEETKVRERGSGLANHAGDSMKAPAAVEQRRVEQVAPRETRSRTLRSSS